MLRDKMMPMQKIHIFWCDPDATDSSGDEDGQKPKKEKTITREMPVPAKKHKTSKPLKTIMPCGTKGVKGPERKAQWSRYRAVPQRGLGWWQAEIHNPLTKGQEYSSHNTEEASGAAYQAKRSQYRAEMLAMKAQPSVSEHVAFSNSSLASSVYSCVSSEQRVQEAQKIVGIFMEIHHEPLDESLLTPTPREISEDATLDSKCELPDIDSVSLADEHPHDDFRRPEDMFPVSDFMNADTNKPPDDDYIGLADISHLHPPFKDPEFDWDAELDWSRFDFASLEHELWLL